MFRTQEPTELSTEARGLVLDGVTFLAGDLEGRDATVRIGRNVTIRAGSFVYAGAQLGDDVVIDHGVIIREGAVVGRGSRIMNLTEIGRDVVVGQECRIRGFVCNRAIIGDRVSALGAIVHRYDIPSAGLVEPSPRIGDGAVLGINSTVAGDVSVPDGFFLRAGAVYSVGRIRGG